MGPRPKSPASSSSADHAESAKCNDDKELILHHLLVLFRHGDRSPISRNISAEVKMTQAETEFWASRLADLRVVDSLNSGTRVTTYHDNMCTEFSCYGQHFKVPLPPQQGGRWPYGQLTAKGIDMMRTKGKQLRDRYRNLLDTMENATRQVYVESTNIERTMRSAQSLLAGLFPAFFEDDDIENKLSGSEELPTNGRQILKIGRKDGKMKTKEVFVIHADDSNSLAPQHSYKEYTDRGKILAKELKTHGPPGFTEALERLSAIIGARSSKHVSWTGLREVLVCHESHGLAFPKGVDQQLFVQICEYDAWLWHQMYGRMDFCRASFKSGVQRIYSYLTGIIKGTTEHKLSLFSAHDNSLVAFVNALRLQTPRIMPPYGAMLTFEIFRHRLTGDFYLKAVYEGTDVTFAGHEHSPLCPFSVFQQAAQTFLRVQKP